MAYIALEVIKGQGVGVRYLAPINSGEIVKLEGCSGGYMQMVDGVPVNTFHPAEIVFIEVREGGVPK